MTIYHKERKKGKKKKKEKLALSLRELDEPNYKKTLLKTGVN